MNTYQLDNSFELGQSDSEDNINSSQNDQIDTNIFNDLINLDERSTGQFSDNLNNENNNRYFTSNSNEKEKKNENNFIEKKRKNDKTQGKHTKYINDNLMNKSKRLVIKNLFNDINQKLIEVYKDDIGSGMTIKQLFLINQKQIANSNINFNKKFLNKTVGDIFSVNISRRYTNYKQDKNKETIKALKNEQDPEKNEYFNGLFNTTFSECLNNFIGKTVNNKYIKGFKTFNELKNEAKFIKKEKDEYYIEHLEKFLKDYENNLNGKKGRKPRVNKKD